MTEVGSWRERIAIIDLALTALALASGVTDVAAFLTLGDVFTSAMTGNTALLGVALSQGREELVVRGRRLAGAAGACGKLRGDVPRRAAEPFPARPGRRRERDAGLARAPYRARHRRDLPSPSPIRMHPLRCRWSGRRRGGA